MPILLSETKREFAFMLTRECNWHCKYCAVQNKHDQGDGPLLDNDVLENASKVQSSSIVTLFGGEPGLASRELVEKCINILEEKNCTLYLETNGLFIEKYPDLLSHFTEVLYHCSEDLDVADQILQTSFSRVRYLIIVHDENIQKLRAFLDAHSDITFDIIEATYPYPDEMYGPTLSASNKKKLILEFGHRMSRESLSRLIHGKDFERIEFL